MFGFLPPARPPELLHLLSPVKDRKYIANFDVFLHNAGIYQYQKAASYYLNYSTSRTTGFKQKLFGELKHFPQPIHHHHFELCTCRARHLNKKNSLEISSRAAQIFRTHFVYFNFDNLSSEVETEIGSLTGPVASAVST